MTYHRKLASRGVLHVGVRIGPRLLLLGRPVPPTDALTHEPTHELTDAPTHGLPALRPAGGVGVRMGALFATGPSPR